ncbi:MAG: MATE family efflux transporter [Pygmaiobacter massiliensis]|nr:MATE family efflux transporter [Pygmaiobacter massiliensis]
MSESAAAERPLFTSARLRRLIGPLVVEQFLAITIGMADTIMVSSAGEVAVSAVSLVDAINVLMLNLFTALAAGGAIVASQYLGKQDLDNARRAARQLMFVLTVLGGVLGLLCCAVSGQFLALLYSSAQPDILSNATLYFRVTSLSYPFIAAYNAGTAIFRAQGNSRVSMQASIISNSVNIGGNAILIYGLKMGVLGAAIPTLVGRIVGAILVFALLRNPTLQVSLRDWREFKVRPQMIRRILKVGVPNGLENSMFHIGKILVQSLVSTLGATAIAANAVANTVSSLPQIPSMAVGLAMTIVVGQCVGAGQLNQARRYTLRLMALATATMCVLCLAAWPCVPLLLQFFNLSAATGAVTGRILTEYFLLAALTWPWSFTLPNALRAAGDVSFTMVVAACSMWIFRIGFSYLLVLKFGLGIYGVWYAMYLDWLVRIILFIWRFLSGKWRNKAVI